MIQPVQNQHLTPRQQCAIQLERRILRGGADKNYRTVLQIGKETVLLCPVEAVDLVDEQKCSLPRHPTFLCRFEYPAQIRDAREDRRQRFEMQVR